MSKKYPVALKSLVPHLPIRDHNNLRGRFESYIGQFPLLKSSTYYETTTYTAGNQTTKSYNMTQDFAEGFCVAVDPVKGFEYVSKMKAKIRAMEAERVRLLEEKILLLEEKTKNPKVKVVSSQKDRKSLHMQRQELHIRGLCDHWTETVTHHYFPVNDIGKLAGYTNTGKGKRTTIDLNKKETK